MHIPHLLKRLTWAAGGVAALKLLMGMAVPLPSSAVVTAYMSAHPGSLLHLYSLLSGGALARGSALALGIMPCLSARLFMLLAPARLDRKWWTRGVTLGISLIQSYGYAQWTQHLPGAVSHPGLAYTAQTMVMLTSASMLLALFVEDATATDEPRETGVLPREGAETVRPRSSTNAVRDPLYISHPTPLP